MRIVGIEYMPSVQFVEQAVCSAVSESHFKRTASGSEARYEITHTNPNFVLEWLSPGGNLLLFLMELAKRHRRILIDSGRWSARSLDETLLHTFDGYEDRTHLLFRFLEDY